MDKLEERLRLRGFKMKSSNSRFRVLFLVKVACCILILDLLPVPAAAVSFSVPERLNYDLTWTGVKAGEASLEISEAGGEIKITSIARSAKWLSFFYTVDDRVESRLAKNESVHAVGQPVNYKLNLREGRHRKNKEVIFDHHSSKVTYIDYLDKERKEFDIPPLTFDAISSFYYLRTLPLEVGRSVYVTIFDSKKVWNVEVLVLRKEKIEVPVGEFNTIVVKPLMQSEGIFYRKGDIYIWLTDDEKRIPVMLKTKVKVGSITASLVGGSY